MLKQNFSLVEIETALRLARLAPAATSPIATVKPATEPDAAILQSLRSKGVANGSALSPEWLAAFSTLADPQQQATAYIEGGGLGRYFGSSAGVYSLVPVAEGQYRILDMSLSSALSELNELIGWRTIPDGPPTRFDFPADELTMVAAVADAQREEQLRAIIERRAPNIQRVSRADAERQVATGVAKPDRHWLVSILAHFAPEGSRPTEEALHRGAGLMVRRGWAKPAEGSIELGNELQNLCLGFASLTPFLSLAVGAPWAEPRQSLFFRSLTGIWSIEFRESDSGPHATVSRLGARATEDSLRKHLGALWPEMPRMTVPPPALPKTAVTQAPAAARPAPVAAPAAPAPTRQQVPVQSAAVPTSVAQSGACRKCGTPLKPQSKFCIKCGAAAGASASPVASPVQVTSCPRCAKPLKPGAKFCTGCGTQVAQAAKPN